MDFTYNSYLNLIDLIKKHNYTIASYHNWNESNRSVILRHDIDYDLDKAVELANYEKQAGVSSTFFVLVSSDFYNIYSASTKKKIKDIIGMGHEIGLHFDETCYDSDSDIIQNVFFEKSALESAVKMPVRTLSMHRPSKRVLDMNLEIDGIVNSYSNIFFRDIKYLSDSRRRWREPVESIVSSEEFDHLQILTHAFWYNESNRDIHESVREFVNGGNESRYNTLKDNITDLNQIMEASEVK